jgi:1,4-dihydroxy-6-naphthoate synthase
LTVRVNEIARLLKGTIRYARDLDPALADRFVGMYVNEWTVDYGPRGREAVRTPLDRAAEAGIIPAKVDVEFVG